jgi:hypothetical protein
MTRQPTAAGPSAGRKRRKARNIREARNTWQIAMPGSGRTVRRRLRVPRGPLCEKVMPISDPGGIAPKEDNGNDHATVLLGWPRIFPGI